MNRHAYKVIGIIVALSTLGSDCDETVRDSADSAKDSATVTTTITTPTEVGYVRITHLVADVANVDVFLGDASDPLTYLSSGGNTDSGYDYIAFPVGDYTVKFLDYGVEHIAVPTTVALDTYYTVLGIGSVGAGLLDPTLAPQGLVVADDVSAAGPGEHRLTVFHVAPGSSPADLWTGGGATATGLPEISALGYGTWSTISTASGIETLYADANSDGIAEISWTLTLADGGWSYVYLTADPTLYLPFSTAIHHVRSVANNPIAPD